MLFFVIVSVTVSAIRLVTQSTKSSVREATALLAAIDAQMSVRLCECLCMCWYLWLHSFVVQLKLHTHTHAHIQSAADQQQNNIENETLTFDNRRIRHCRRREQREAVATTADSIVISTRTPRTILTPAGTYQR